MGWVMGGLDKSDYDREYGDFTLLRRIIGYFRPYGKMMGAVSIATTLSALAGTLVPLLISTLLNKLDQKANQSVVINLVLLVLAFGILNFVLNAVSQEFTARAVQNAVLDLRENAFDALLGRDMSFFDNEPAGRLASRVTNDSNDFGTVVTLTTNLFAQLLIIFFILGILLTQSLKLTVLVLIFAPFTVIAALSYRKVARKFSLSSQRILAKVNALIQETTTGIYIAKSFRAEKSIYDEFSEMNDLSYDVNLKRGLIFDSIFPVLNVLSALATAIIVYFGALNILGVSTALSNLVAFIPGPALTIGGWYLFLSSLNYFFNPLIQIASFWSQFQQGLAASERIFSLIDTENEVKQVDNQLIKDPKGKIDFENIDFSYIENVKVLENFDLHIKGGEKVAIVGHTGAGKSTLAKLIARYYEYQDGRILIDNQDIRSLNLEEYRKHLAIISQEVFLWNGTIRENLLYGIEHVIDAENRLMEVLKQVDALDWIDRLEFGLDTNIGERGSKLSQGQRQLVAFARILLRNPSILIMDEATASVDPLTEVKIQRATDLILEGRTSIIIAHRLSTVRNVDRIIVMKEGKIIEEGNHEELLKNGGHYAELYDTYFRHQSLEYIESIAD